MLTLPFGLIVHGSNDGRVANALREFCSVLSTSTRLRIEPRVVLSGQALVDGLADESLDLAWTPPLIALELHQRQVAEPLVVLKRGFRAGYHSALFVRADSNLETIDDLLGTRVAWVSHDSASGYVAPRWHLGSLGKSADELFAEQTVVGDHLRVARAVIDGHADVGATHVAVDPTTGQLLAAPWLELGADPRDIRVILLIGPIPGDVIACANRITAETRRRIAAVLLALPAEARPFADQVFQAHHFDPARPGHLDLLRGLAPGRTQRL